LTVYGLSLSSIFILSNYYLADNEVLNKSFEIIERRSLKNNRGYSRALITINHNGLHKEITFAKEYIKNLNSYKTVKLDIQKGFFGFDIIKNKSLEINPSEKKSISNILENKIEPLFFTNQQVDDLEKIIIEFEERTGKKIAFYIVKSNEPYSGVLIYGKNLDNEWGASKLPDNSLKFYVDIPEQGIWVTAGQNVEQIVKEEICDKIIKQSIIPKFKEDNFYEGVKQGLVDLITEWK